MRTYLSMGGGVNSVAMHLLMLDQGVNFESVFVNHGTDWPETYQYMAGFQWWLKANGHRPITVLRPKNAGHWNLYDYCWRLRTTPVRRPRWCTSKFKVETLHRYYKGPAFDLIGIDSGEAHRAKIMTHRGIERRYPLIEAGIDRQGCIDIIKSHDLPIPMKSGCYICPFQRRGQWIDLRMKHPCLFQAAADLENRNQEYRKEKGKPPFYIFNKNTPLSAVIDENQSKLWPEDEYPPCQCFL